MKLILPPNIVQQLIDVLRKSGHKESGGILMGEHLSKNQFRIMEITVQHGGGAIASFVRFLNDIITPLNQFFQKTDHKYQKYNYLGEWHSHPSFRPIPSQTDIQSMFEIICDKEVGANFVVLLILKLDTKSEIEGTVTTFLPNMKYYQGELIMENNNG